VADNAVIGLMGAVVGGVLTTMATFGLEYRRELRERRVEERRRNLELAQASRLVAHELLVAVNQITEASNLGLSLRPLATDAWDEWKHVLVIGLPQDVWSKVMLAYSQIDLLEGVERERGRQPPRGVLDAATAGLEGLEPHSGVLAGLKRARRQASDQE
jgi:hypothetical protein